MKFLKIVLSLFFVMLFSFQFALATNFSNNTNISASISSEKKGVLQAEITQFDTTITLETGETLENGLALIGDEIVTISNGGTTIVRAETHPHAASVASTATPHRKGSVIRNLTQNVIVSFTPSVSIGAFDEVLIFIPNNSPNTFGAIGVASVSPGVSTPNTEERSFTLDVSGTSQQNVTITGLEMPGKFGQYSIPVEIRTNTGSLKESGFALVSWGTDISIKAFISPSLIFTLDKTNIDITADPSVNDGEDFSQKSILTIRTNNKEGYKIQSNLKGKNTSANAQLDNVDGNVIASGDAFSAENVFSYIAYNGDGSALEQTLDSAGRTNMASEVTRTLAEIKSDAVSSSLFSNTDADLLPVTALAGGVTPGDSSSIVAYKSFINDSKHTVYYLLNVDFTVPSGEYEGIVTYTALPRF